MARSHARSNSFPSTTHPVAATVEDHLCRLKSADAICPSTSSICKNLASLAGLHERLHDLIQLPSVQQELSNRSADQILDGSVRLLDVCSTAKDIMVHMKESVKELESAIRRNRGGESSIAHDINTYAISKRKINKMIIKCVKNLKISTKKSSINEEGSILSNMIMLEESEEISFSIMKSLLMYMSGNKEMSKTSGWSLVNKFVQSKQKQSSDVNDITKIDDTLSAIIKAKESKAVAIQNVMKHLRTLEMTIQEIEELLETIFRSLIKRRVSLLNILDH